MNASLLEYPMGLWLLGRHFKDKHRCLVELGKAGYNQVFKRINLSEWVKVVCGKGTFFLAL